MALLVLFLEVRRVVFFIVVNDQIARDVIAKHEYSVMHCDGTARWWICLHIWVLVVVCLREPIHSECNQVLLFQQEGEKLVECLVDHLFRHGNLPDVALLKLRSEDVLKLLFEGTLVHFITTD